MIGLGAETVVVKWDMKNVGYENAEFNFLKNVSGKWRDQYKNFQ